MPLGISIGVPAFLKRRINFSSGEDLSSWYEPNTGRGSTYGHRQSVDEPYNEEGRHISHHPDDHQIKDLTNDNKGLKRDYEDLKRKYKDLKSQKKALSSDNDTLLKVNDNLRREVNSLGIERDSLHNANVKLLDENGNFRAAYEKQRLEIEKLYQDYQSLERHAQDLQNHLTSTENNLRQADIRHNDDTKLLNQRTSELEAVSTFFPMTDEISGAELKGKVEALNDEIMQQAAVISDALEDAERILTEDENTKQSAHHLVEQGILDHSLVESLRSSRIEPYHLQVVLQAAMVHAAHRVIKCLDPYKVPLIDNLASGIANTERYPIAAKWRAITHAQICQLGNVKAEHAPLFNNILTAVLTVAGWRHEAERLDFPRRLDHIIDTAIELNKTLMQKVFSMQVQLLEFVPRRTFNPMVMEDESAEVSENQPVLCTTGLGLAFSLVDPQATSSTRVQWEYALKAKVITPKVFEMSFARQ